MGNPDTACIAFKISQAPYRPLFELVWGADFDIKWPGNAAEICGTPNGAARFGGSATPIALSPDDRTKANNIYDHWGQSISFLESSKDISPFTSKFDAFLAGTYTLTADEMAGYNLFNGKANCNSCHLDGLATGATGGTPADTEPCSPASATPISACRSIRGFLSSMKARRTASGLRPIPTASGSEIWVSARSSGAVPAPAQIRTPSIGYNLRRLRTARCRPRPRAMWR